GASSASQETVPSAYLHPRFQGQEPPAFPGRFTAWYFRRWSSAVSKSAFVRCELGASSAPNPTGSRCRSARCSDCVKVDGVMNLPVLGSLTLSGFAHRWYFAFLLAIVGLVTLYVFMQLIRRKRLLRFANMELLESVAPKRPTRWRHLPGIILVIALILLTVAMAGPTRDVRTPRNRAVVMLVIDVSQSMRATDVSPSRLAAAQDAAKQFADELTPGVNLGLISYAGTPAVLVSPTTNRDATKAALDKLQVADRTATGEAIFTAL